MRDCYLYDIITLRSYDVTILKLKVANEEWFCAYLKFKGNINKKEYCCETFRMNNIIGIDTNHFYNRNQSLDAKYKDCIRQISAVIEEHDKEIYYL